MSHEPRKTLDSISMATVPQATHMEALLENTRAAFMRHGREPSASDGDVDGDAQIEVVIVQNVTSEDYASIDEACLFGLVDKRREDGRLVPVDVLSYEYTNVRIAIAAAASNYVDVNEAAALSVTGNEGCRQDRNAEGAGENGNRNPDLIISQGDSKQRLVVFLLDVATCPRSAEEKMETMIRDTVHYFRTNPSLRLVVWIQLYPVRVTRTNDVDVLEIPALAVVFERGDLSVSGLIRVLDARSFGNADVHTNALRILEFPALNNPPLPLEPFVGVARVNQYTSTGTLRRANLIVDVRAWNQLERQQPMVVPVPGGLPPLVLPLFWIFSSAVAGWNQDAAR